MGFDFFPAKMNSVKASRYENQLKIVRIVSLVLMAGLLALNILDDVFDIYSISTWCVLYSLLFEIAAVLSYFNNAFDKIGSILYLIAWHFNGTMAFMLYYFSSSFGLLDLIVFLPFTVVLVDFIYNKVSFIRLQYIFPVGLLVFDVFFWYSEFALLDVMMSSEGALISKLVFIGLSILFLEISRLIKVRSCKEDECEQSLL